MDGIGWDGMGYLQTGPFLDHLAVIIKYKVYTDYDDISVGSKVNADDSHGKEVSHTVCPGP